MTAQSDEPREQKPAPTRTIGSDIKRNPTKPRRMTLEELWQGMTPDKKPLFEDD